MALPIVHHPDYDAESVPDGHRFPMRKYSLLATLLRERGERFAVPAHAPERWLHLAHDPAYVTAVLTSSVDARTARRIGFEMTPAIAARTRASVGGTCLAARLALQEGARVLFDLPERPKERALREMAVAWSPWRSVAARALWAYYHVAKNREGIA